MTPGSTAASLSLILHSPYWRREESSDVPHSFMFRKTGASIHREVQVAAALIAECVDSLPSMYEKVD